MNVTCHNCKTRFTIPEHRVPRDKTSIFTCPKCREKIQVPAAKQQKTIKTDKLQSFNLSFDERLNALVCINGDDFKKKVVSTLRQMGLNAEAVTHTQSAMKRLEYHICHLVLVDDEFDQNRGAQSIIDRMNTIDMSLRRRICLVWISKKFNTNDNLASLHSSVNAILNQGDILHLEPFLSRVLLEHKQFYTVYNESLKLAGKI
jgi:zinc-ribbon domain